MVPALVSVVISAHNAAAVIAGQLEGLSQQDDAGRWEVVVADNGSSDDPAAVVAPWAMKLPALQVSALITSRVRAGRPPVSADQGMSECGFLPYARGASLGVRAQVLDRLGAFDEAYAGGADEIDFCWRAPLAGFTLGDTSHAAARLCGQPVATARQRTRRGQAAVPPSAPPRNVEQATPSESTPP